MSPLPVLFLALAALLDPQASSSPPAAPAAATDPKAAEARALVLSLAGGDAAAAARAEIRLTALGRAATPALVEYLLAETRVPSAVSAILRVIARVRDRDAIRGLWPEWDRNPDGRRVLIDVWAVFDEEAISPLAGYFASADTEQRERIVEILGALGERAVPAFRTLQLALAADPGGVTERINARIETHIVRAPVVTLARKGVVALRDLELLASDPSTPASQLEAAVEGIRAIARSHDAGAGALARLAAGPAGRGPLGGTILQASDEARMLMLARMGEAAIDEYVAIARDPQAREGLRIEALNGLFGLGEAALPALRALGGQLPAGAVADYLRDLTGSLAKATPAGRAPGASSPAPKGPSQAAAKPAAPAGEVPAGETCFNDAPFNLISRIPIGGLPISPRWFRASANGLRLFWTTLEAGFYRIVLSRADGAEQVTLAPVAHQFAPSMSWDSRRLAFLGNAAPITEPLMLNDVYLSDLDGTHLKKVTAGPGIHTSPVWLVKRDEIVYAWIRLASPATGGPERTESLISRYGDTSGERQTIVTLTDRIVTAIEPAPDFRRLAFLSFAVDGPRAGDLFVHVTDTAGNQPKELLLLPALPATGKHTAPTLAEAIALGGDLTWSADSRILTAAGRVIDVEGLTVEARIDPAGDLYALRLASRTFFATDTSCGTFNDTRQVVKRCPPRTSVEIVADCRGALVWQDEGRGRLGLFDALNGNFGFLQFRTAPKRSPDEAPVRPGSVRDLPAPRP